MREFVGEYGKGVRQENVRSKTKELTGTLPYALSMREGRRLIFLRDDMVRR